MARSQGNKKLSEAKDSPFENRPFLGQGHRPKCFPKKKKKVIIITRSSKIFFTRFKKKGLQKLFSGDLKKTNFSTKNDLQNFKDSKHTAILEPRTGQFSRT